MTSRSCAEEVVIVGAGPAGMLLAFLLVEHGFPVHIIERHRDFAREFRGEGIQASVVAHLRELNLLDELLEVGAAIPAHEARVLFRVALPVMSALGVRGRLLRRAQGGVTRVRFQPQTQRLLHVQNEARPR